jgi:hypothetical protein
MIPQSKPSYLALKRAANDERVFSFENKKGFVFLFAALVFATLCGMVFFIHFLTTELPVKEISVFEMNRNVRDLLIEYGEVDVVEAAPYYYACAV